MKSYLIIIFFAIAIISCDNEDPNPIPVNSSYVNLVFTDIKTDESLASGNQEVHLETSKLNSGIYFNGPNYFLTKDVSFDINLPNGEIFEATLSFHKYEEDPQLIEVNDESGNWTYNDPGNYFPYYSGHLDQIFISNRKSGGMNLVNSYESSLIQIDGVNKTKLEIQLDHKFVNSVYLPESDQKGFNASGTMILIIE